MKTPYFHWKIDIFLIKLKLGVIICLIKSGQYELNCHETGNSLRLFSLATLLTSKLLNTISVQCYLPSYKIIIKTKNPDRKQVYKTKIKMLTWVTLGIAQFNSYKQGKNCLYFTEMKISGKANTQI